MISEGLCDTKDIPLMNFVKMSNCLKDIAIYVKFKDGGQAI